MCVECEGNWNLARRDGTSKRVIRWEFCDENSDPVSYAKTVACSFAGHYSPERIFGSVHMYMCASDIIPWCMCGIVFLRVRSHCHALFYISFELAIVRKHGSTCKLKISCLLLGLFS